MDPLTDEVTVLLVDDQPRFLAAATAVVASTPGFRVVGQAADGAAAVARVAELTPRLVLMDIHMPVLDGIAATRRILDDLPTTVVVLLSSYDRDDLPDGVATSGAHDYLHKEELEPAALLRLWEQHRPR